jgi:lipopolysaccharide export system protein LptA
MKTNVDATKLELAGVTLHLFHKDGKTYDSVTSAKAEFDHPNARLFSEGEVEITMGVPSAEEQPPPGNKLVVIRTSGVHFESTTGKAFTDRPATFRFDRGEGQSTGAQYDPETRELMMFKDVKLTWRGTDHKKKPMDIESGSLVYKESEAKVLLLDWSRFRRDTLAMEGGAAVVNLKESRIDSVEAAAAKGTDTRPDRTIEYAADQLNMYFHDSGQLKNIAGLGNARLRSTSKTSKTNVTSGRLDLEFEPGKDDTELRRALATTTAVVRSEPVPKPKVPTPDTRIVKSDIIALTMREGGREMERVDTQAPGVVEFIPNRPGQKHRTVSGQSMNVEYGPDNQVKTFVAQNVTTRTDNEPVKGKPQPPSLTSSKGMAAHFDPKTGNLTLLEQWDDFHYEEGDRKATANRAELHQADDVMKLLGAARVWDSTGSTTADTIQLAQKSGDFEAIGNVNSTRQPDRKKESKDASGKVVEAAAPGTGTGMLTGDDPVQARAARMTSAERNGVITYTGNAILWQASNRITADTIRIDRKNNQLWAKGNVVSQLLDKSETNDPKKKAKSPVFTNVRAPEMTYDDKTRLAHYKGGAVLTRGGMTVNAQEIRAWLKEGEDSSLDHAFADGDVKIHQVAPERIRDGVAEHSEYYATEGRIVLSGGQPEFTDSVQGKSTRGTKITYFTNNERLLVEGEEKTPVRSRILRRKSAKP